MPEIGSSGFVSGGGGGGGCAPRPPPPPPSSRLYRTGHSARLEAQGCGDRRAMTTYCCLGCKCLGSCVCTLTCGDGGVGTGLRVELAIGSGEDASVLGRCFCSD